MGLLTTSKPTELAALFDRPGPRYTSYPTAVQFHAGFGPADAQDRLRRASLMVEEPFSLYIHIPFCERRCSYCACHVIPTRKKTVADRYLDHLEKEAALVARALGARRNIQVLHLGGGTPTYLTPDQIERLFDILQSRFKILPGAEISVELDPRVTTPEHLAALRRRGMSRASLGVQDLDTRVQEAIGRNQNEEETRSLHRSCREAGIEGINFDLVYGLPYQSLDTMAHTIDEVVSLRPDRLALYGYAHVPWVRANQKEIPEDALPGPVERLELFQSASGRLEAAGYLPIGMDHFTLPSDDLAIAARARRLGRNFMGYTPHARLDLVGLGLSSVSQVDGDYVQNEKNLARYYQALEEGGLPVERGYSCNRDDVLRRGVIHAILCQLEIDPEAFEKTSGVPFASYFRDEIPRLGVFLERDLLRREGKGYRVAPAGRPFLRNLAMIFDRHNREPQGHNGAEKGPRFSRTV